MMTTTRETTPSRETIPTNAQIMTSAEIMKQTIVMISLLCNNYVEKEKNSYKEISLTSQASGQLIDQSKWVNFMKIF